jgi:hypothetical protein
MEVVHLTLQCCRHAIVVIRHEWSRRKPAEGGRGWRNLVRERAWSKADA